ncbi:Rieske 2Fe-2S domain-containing protein [Streptomyces sp. NPDC059003]|uniref:Rieske 2Fe-2S domain-containing protein n=1 Tax=Streptomyces sp. NPDC059003 TaxID=3346691 RepID=UPI00368955F9
MTTHHRVPAGLAYPTGWFALGFSGELKPGRVVTSRIAGGDIVLYRTRSGTVHATDPFCPHLGAHLGHGGGVEGEDIVCPFHGFAFAPDGRCARVPGGTNPPRAVLTKRPVREVDGMIFVWWNSQGSPPAWEPGADTLTGYSRQITHMYPPLQGHIQDAAENAADLAHFSKIHGWHNAKVTVADFSTPISTTEISATYHGLPILVRIVQHGLGQITGLATVPSLGVRAHLKGFPVQTEPDQWVLRTAESVKVDAIRHLPFRQGIHLAVNHAAQRWWTIPQQMRDIVIWTTKTYLEHPRLSSADGPIMAMRRWAAQFYDHSMTALKQAEEVQSR